MDNDFDKVISSPIRWAGSKKKLLNEMLKAFFIRDKDNYIEPFLGSGVVLINVLNNNSILKYKNFYVNDVNKNVINFYIAIKDNLDELIKNIKNLEKQYNAYTYEEKEKMYYDMREKYNNTKTKEKNKTAIFYFLMKTGFNGVYRENKKGEFNVPFGRKEIINVDYNNLIEISNLIQKVNFYCMDYKDFFEMVKENKTLNNSFVYCDPPYLPEDNCVTKRIDIYTKESFNHEEFFNNIKEYNTCTMISLARTEKSDQIYNRDKFKRVSVSNIVRTVNPKKIFTSEESAYINYKIER